MTVPIRAALVGLGKIARDQHLPSIVGDPEFELAATVDPRDAGIAGLPHFAGLDALDVPIDAVILCTPPQARRALALTAIERGWHVLLEKPPAATPSEAASIGDAAAARGVTAFAAWHSRFAAAVEPARTWLSGRRIARADHLARGRTDLASRTALDLGGGRFRGVRRCRS